jgi:hypothetical protein
MSSPASLVDVLRLARQLSPREKALLIEQIAPEATSAQGSASTGPARRRGLRGLLRGCTISANEVDAFRREQWKDFAREDV